jgi:hypothetical protein
MKFYRYNINYFFHNNIIINNLTAVYLNYFGSISFYKNGKNHNTKNTAYIHNDNKFNGFYLNGNFYGYKDDFTKHSWRKFVKLQAFL